MRYIKLIPLVLFTVVIALASCQNDDLTPDTPNIDGGEANVSLRLSVKSPTVTGVTTRAAVTEKGTAGEFMKNWVILVVQNNSIKQILSSKAFEGERSADSTYVRLQDGTYDFYTFANISLDSLGLATAKAGDNLPDGFDNKAFHVEGNQLSISDFKNGIPMSNKQTVTISNTTNRIDLDVIRMVAKVRVEVTNPTDDALTIYSLFIRDITKNPGKDTLNVGLLPGEISNASTGKRSTRLVPTRDNNIERVTFADTLSVERRTIAAHSKDTVTFYVNESEASNADSTRFLGKHFVLNVRRGTNVRGTVYSRRGYSTLQSFSFTDWSSMARNEIHVLPITLEKYDIAIDVYPYTAIGVLPQYSNDNNIFTIFFGLYGHYDLVPRIRNYENGYDYYMHNTIANDSVTYRKLYYSASDGSEDKDKEVQISNLNLRTDNKQVGIPYSSEGWGDNPDGSGDTKNNPIVGWNPSAAVPRIECIVGNYTGSAIYTIDADFREKGKDKDINLSRRFRIANTYFDLSNLAKKRR